MQLVVEILKLFGTQQLTETDKFQFSRLFTEFQSAWPDSISWVGWVWLSGVCSGTVNMPQDGCDRTYNFKLISIFQFHISCKILQILMRFYFYS